MRGVGSRVDRIVAEAAGESFSIAVVGGGPAGLAVTLALRRLGLPLGLAFPKTPAAAVPDRRTAALFGGSIELLKNLGVWPALAPHCEPITGIRLIDDRGTWIKAPEVLFTAAEIGRDELGFNVPNAPLVNVLANAVRSREGGQAVVEAGGVTGIEIGAGSVGLTTDDGRRLSASLVVGADGRGSPCRQAAGIKTSNWSYPQSAVVCSFAHSRAHGGISTELHRPAGPLTVVPMPGAASSLVWVEAPTEAQRLASLGEKDFRSLLERRLMGLLGSVSEIGPRGLFPLSGLSAETQALSRIALVGEASHVIPPIGAQGLNLSLRDAATLADCVADAVRNRQDIGGDETLASYAAARSHDVTQRVWTVDLLNRSLLSDLTPVHLLRAAGLVALSAVGPLRRLVVREGVQPAAATPSLMQPGGDELLTSRLVASAKTLGPVA